ncbi:MAG TPA: biotin/lipoyl-containing protein [Ignavibacteriaceae bacterium]|nr:biotin/lipoyl-containing protein [Ignavibacteriaceae bacterium]
MKEEKKNSFILDDTVYETNYSEKYLKRKPYKKDDPRKVIAFIPGQIKMLYVKKGDKVKTGDRLLILEAMKMENNLVAPVNGTVKHLHVKTGEKVANKQLLIELE